MRFLNCFITLFVLADKSSAVRPSPIAKYLRSVGEAFDRFLTTSGTDDNAPMFRAAVQKMIDSSIAAPKPDRELNLIAETLIRYRESDGPKDHMELAHQLLVVPDIFLTDFLDSETALNERLLLEVAKRLGMSRQDFRSFRSAINSSEVPEAIHAINSGVSEFLQSTAPGDPIPCALNGMIGVRSLVIERLAPAWSRMNAVSSIGEELMEETTKTYGLINREFPLLIEGLVIVNSLPGEMKAAFRDHSVLLYRCVREVADALREGQEDENVSRLLSQIEEQVRPVAQELKALGDPMRRFKDELIEKVLTVISEARIIIVPRLLVLIESALAVERSEQHCIFLSSVIDSFVRILTSAGENTHSLVSLSTVLDVVTVNLNGLFHDQGVAHEWNVLRAAFYFSKIFHIRFLTDYPEVLAGWSEEKIILTRKIIGVFLKFDGPRQWARSEVYSLIPEASEARLTTSITVLTHLYIERCQTPEKTPLVDSGRWLKEFLLNTPSPYAVWIKDRMIHRFWTKVIAKKLFHESEQKLNEFYAYPQRLVDMSDHINALSLEYSGTMPERYFDIYLPLPGHLLREELNAGSPRRNPLVGLVESAISASFETLEVVGEKGYSLLTHANSQAFEECFMATVAISRLLDDLSNIGLRESIEMFVAKTTELKNAIKDNSTVAFPFYNFP